MKELKSDQFNQQFCDAYRKGEGNCAPINPNNHFPTASELKPQADEPQVSEPKPQVEEPQPNAALTEVFGHPIEDYIRAMYPNEVPVGSRHKSALRLESDLLILQDGNEAATRQVLTKISWIRELISERGEGEIDRIIDAATKRLHKRESENLYDPQPSKDMRRAIEQVTRRKYNELVKEAVQQGEHIPQGDIVANILKILEQLGDELTKFFPDFPLLRLVCHGMLKKHYIAAMFVGGAFAMTLMTRTWYQFWPSPGCRCRMNCLLELIGRMGSGKRMLVDLYKLMMEPVKKADAAQVEALNQWNAEREQKSGASKNKIPRPQGIFRSLPCESSAAAIREAEFNAKEMVQGEEIPLHVSIVDSELDNTLRQIKKGYMDINSLWLKAFHNEPQGAYLKTSSSRVGEYNVHANFMYSGTEYALNKQVTIDNYNTGLCTRITCVPMGDSNFEMMENREYTEKDRQREEELRTICYELDNTVGEIPCKNISEALYEWTKRRMADAAENESKAEEDLLKRVGWHAANYALPFVTDRHKDQMVEKDGRRICGSNFTTDTKDVKLALLIAKAQWIFQQYFFKGIAENYYDNSRAAAASNTHHQERTRLAYNRLPDIFTAEDVDKAYGYEGKTGSICSRLKRLQDDGLSIKIRSGINKGKYRKLA